MKKHVIITGIDEKYGNFLINHWLRSLKENVDLSAIDIVVIDYGLSEKQKKNLLLSGVRLFPGAANGHIVNLRFMDAAKYLRGKKYDQVMLVDGGDIIFQADISQLFTVNKDYYRAADTEAEVLYYEWFLPNNFSKINRDKFWKILKNKRLLNAGLIVAPKNKFLELCSNIEKLVLNKYNYGPDQVVVNYVLHRDGFKLLDRKYNYLINTVNDKFSIKAGVFYSGTNELISVVHNAGREGIVSTIKNFGYRRRSYRINYPIYYARRFFSSIFKLGKDFLIKPHG